MYIYFFRIISCVSLVQNTTYFSKGNTCICVYIIQDLYSLNQIKYHVFNKRGT